MLGQQLQKALVDVLKRMAEVDNDTSMIECIEEFQRLRTEMDKLGVELSPEIEASQKTLMNKAKHFTSQYYKYSYHASKPVQDVIQTLPADKRDFSNFVTAVILHESLRKGMPVNSYLEWVESIDSLRPECLSTVGRCQYVYHSFQKEIEQLYHYIEQNRLIKTHIDDSPERKTLIAFIFVVVNLKNKVLDHETETSSDNKQAVVKPKTPARTRLH